jgi:hypothetical protein
LITHIVFFKLNDPTPVVIEKTRQALQSLYSKVPSLKHIEVGVDVLKNPRSYDIALIAKFDSLAGLNEYEHHPEHVKVGEYIRSVSKSVVSVDYESK